MQTQIVDKKAIPLLVEKLQNNEVIAFPTETVYGLGVIYDSAKAIENLKWAKKRPESKPFTLMVASTDDFKKFAKVSQRDMKLINAFTPGPITFIFDKQEHVEDYMTNGFKTIGIRYPDDPFVLQLIRTLGKPMLVPSANISGMAPAKTSDEVLEQLDGRIAMVVEGKCNSGISSTIVDLTNPQELSIIRQGEITLEKLKEALL